MVCPRPRPVAVRVRSAAALVLCWGLAGLLIAAVLLTGCSVVTKPTGVVTIPRQDFVNSFALAKAIYLKGAERVQALCVAELLSPQRCQAARETDEAAKRLDLEVQAKLLVPESEINWDVILRMLELTAKVVI